MAVAFDAVSELERTGTSDPATWTHTPVGTPRGVVVMVVHGTDTTDYVSSVTYGGVSLTRIIRALDTVTEPGAAEIWFCGSGLPTGAQTVSCDLTSATTEDMHFVAATITASADTEVIDSDKLEENRADPSVTLSYAGKTAISFGIHYGGGANPTAFTPNGNCTTIADVDLGNFYSEAIRQTTPGTSDFAIGGTVVTEDVAFAAVAISEVVGATTVLPGVGSLVITGFAPAVGLPQTVLPGLGQLTITGFAPTINTGPTVLPGLGQLTITGFAPAIGLPRTVTPGLGQLTITGFAPTVNTGPTVLPGVGSVVITGFSPSIGLPRTVLPGLGQLTITGFAPAVGLPRTVLPGAGALVITGFAPALGLPVTVRPGVGALVITGFAPVVSSGPTVQPGFGDLVITGYAPIVEALSTEVARTARGRRKNRRRQDAVHLENLRRRLEEEAAQPLEEMLAEEIQVAEAEAEVRAEEQKQVEYDAGELFKPVKPKPPKPRRPPPINEDRFALARKPAMPAPIDVRTLRMIEEEEEEIFLRDLLARL